MASTKFKVGDKITTTNGLGYNDKRHAYVVEEPERYSKDTIDYSRAVWADWWDDMPTHSDEDNVVLVSAGDGRDQWRTVTKKEKRLLKSLLNNSIEFRIQVRVKGVN